MEENKAASTAARLASAAYNIAKGAASGGPAGAAAGAAVSFLPELLKAAAIILFIFVLLPILIIVSLPNILFGFDSAKSADIIAMTDKAYSVEDAYQSVESFGEDHMSNVITQLEQAYTDEDGVLQYDEMEVLKDTDNLNIYWFIAINSVANGQDLWQMDEASIRDMTVRTFRHNSLLELVTKGEGEDAVTIRKLKVNFETATPEELMAELAFSEEQKNWARLMYSTLTDEQYVGFHDSDGAGYYNTDYGDIVFTDAETDVVYYNQTDSRWGNESYGSSGTIGTSGCGPTALAIAVASLTDNKVTPKEVSDWSVENGYRCEGNGSYHSLIPNGGAHYGLKVDGIGSDAKKLVEALNEGKLVIAIMSKGHFTSSGHFIVLRGVTKDGNILVADPASVKRSGQEWALSIITSEASRKAGAGGPFWVLSAP